MVAFSLGYFCCCCLRNSRVALSFHLPLRWFKRRKRQSGFRGGWNRRLCQRKLSRNVDNNFIAVSAMPLLQDQRQVTKTASNFSAEKKTRAFSGLSLSEWTLTFQDLDSSADFVSVILIGTHKGCTQWWCANGRKHALQNPVWTWHVCDW